MSPNCVLFGTWHEINKKQQKSWFRKNGMVGNRGFYNSFLVWKTIVLKDILVREWVLVGVNHFFHLIFDVLTRFFIILNVPIYYRSPTMSSLFPHPLDQINLILRYTICVQRTYYSINNNYKEYNCPSVLITLSALQREY